MTAQLFFQKGLLLLDQNQGIDGIEALNKAISLAETEDDQVTLGAASCCLGEFLYFQGKSKEAVLLLEKTLNITCERDLLSYEKRRAQEILTELGGVS